MPLMINFKATKEIKPYIKIDEVNELIMISKELFEYTNLTSFELIEDGETISKGGLGRAVAGGVLFGGIGAIVGGVTGGKRTKSICTSMKFRLNFKHTHTDTKFIDIITSKTKTNGWLYNVFREDAHKCDLALQNIINTNENNTELLYKLQSNSKADEIKKLHQLMESGIITKEEFEAQKNLFLSNNVI